ncbi:MAG TPA: PilT/PilU family type 4a pilus ATPase [Candidatus Paceibacterota bacterium]|nr:PilT/PilU family type 4a pilus ATPase [Verrucomicrobiota bacterium]HRZ46400.1 PilT/PilU family type 4a pilus ATPase [Candidatus Paceibacterota bacterium]HRZ93812.1 PilT/PilU family type 4a pilus ATPase [Candidatus Paceibacterota bacterium]
MDNPEPTLESLVVVAARQGASDLHLEAGLPPAVRIRGVLQVAAHPLPAKSLVEIARALLGADGWAAFEQRRSCDLSRNIAGYRCRFNVFQTSRGIGLALRLLSSFQVTLEKLNLHPDLRRWIGHSHGLILVCGPTGCGKSSTLAAFVQEINLSDARHIVTIESPIEYHFRPVRSYIRQREVGRDTPSFEQALLDALREDPDVLMVGEMRDPETMRLTLNAAETGHLVLSTLHSSTAAEALQRMVSAFPPEIQAGVCAQLADCLIGVIAQRLRHRPDINLRVPECEILVSSTAVKSFIRSREFFKIASSLETGAEHGMWTFTRYRAWLDKRTKWHIPTGPEPGNSEEETSPASAAVPAGAAPASAAAAPAPPTNRPPQRIEIKPVEGGLESLLRRLGGKS